MSKYDAVYFVGDNREESQAFDYVGDNTIPRE